MPLSGFFITLYDEDTLNLYLDRGVYGFLMPPVLGEVPTRSRHYQALADYSCGRKGTHIFFFLKRKIVYGGQLLGSNDFGSFYLNGPYCPLGRISNSKIYWDESTRSVYETTDKTGIFMVQTNNEKEKRCQPYLTRFEDKLGIKGNTIPSDELYFELGSYSYPLPSNSIQNMSFCTLTPGEVDIMITKLRETSQNLFKEPKDKIDLENEPVLFSPSFGLNNVLEAQSEAHLEASVLANPSLLPEELQPGNATLCRQMPISPFKPYQMDRADICFFSDDMIKSGTIPNNIIEIKQDPAGKDQVSQLVRYARWLWKVVPKDAARVSFYIYAPSFRRNARDAVPRELKNQIMLISFHERRLI